MSYEVGVDVGGTFTTAAVVRGGRAEVVKVMPSRLPGVPQGFLRRVGDDTPVLVGARPVPAETLVAQLVTQIVSAVGRPARLAVTHPVTWGPHRVAALRAALGEVTMLSAAAAVAYQRTAPTAVHDLGGADLDELVCGHGCAARDTVPADPAELARLRQACTKAKETLSADTEVEIPVAGTRVRLTRAEFEELARPLLTETAVALCLAIEESGVTPSKVLLAGGAAWLPLLTQVVSEELGRPVAATPPGAAAMGAALAAAGMPVNQPAAVRDQLGAAGNGVPLGRAPRTGQPTRLAVHLEPLPPNELPGPRALLSPAGNGVRTSIVEPVRPPMPVAAAPVEARSRRTRTMVVAAAAVLAVLGSAAALALGSGQAPAGAGADTMPPTSTVSGTVPVTTTEAAPPPVDPPPRRTQQPQPTEKKTQPTTTTTRPAPTTTTTTAPASTPPTTTTSRTTNSRSPPTSGGGDR